MTTINWIGGDGDWNTAGNWSTNTVPSSSDDAVIDAPGTYTVTITASISAGSIVIYNDGATLSISGSGVTASVTNDVTNAGNLTLQDGAALTTYGDFANSGGVNLDTVGTGGSSLTIGGMLTNSVSVSVGNSQLTSSDTINVNALDNTGTINLTGNSSAGNTRQAVLDIAGVAPSDWTGTAVLSGQAMLEFGSGEITSIAQGAGIILATPDGYVASDGGRQAIRR